MPQRIAKVEQEYAGRRIKVGEPFDVEPIHIQLLSALGRIEDEDHQPGKPGTYGTRDMTAQRAKNTNNRKAAR